MIRIDFSAEDIKKTKKLRYDDPHPKVRRRMEALWLKSQGLLHEEIWLSYVWCGQGVRHRWLGSCPVAIRWRWSAVPSGAGWRRTACGQSVHVASERADKPGTTAISVSRLEMLSTAVAPGLPPLMHPLPTLRRARVAADRRRLRRNDW